MSLLPADPSNPTPNVRWLPQEHQEVADLAVLIVNWNVRDRLLANIEALFQSVGSITAELIVIDNASSDGSVEAVKERFPEVCIIASNKNLGFAGGNEKGMEKANARHCLLLNPDMRVQKDALAKTVAYLDAHPDVAVVGAKLVKEDGTILRSVRRFPDIWSQLCIELKVAKLFPSLLNHYLQTDFDSEQEQEVESVRGSYFAIQGKAIEQVGRLDQRYFLWFEEVDYCKQVEIYGWKVMYVPSIKSVDAAGKSFEQKSRFTAQRWFTRSMIQYFVKWHPWWQATILCVVRPFALFACFLADVFRSLFHSKKSYV